MNLIIVYTLPCSLPLIVKGLGMRTLMILYEASDV